MTLHPMIAALGPEIVLAAGACVVLLARGRRADEPTDARPAPRSEFAPLAAVLTIAAALAVLILTEGPQHAPRSLRHDALTWYTRWIGLCVGVVIVMVNRHVPSGPERHEFFALLLFSLAGLLTAAAANDLIVLFLALELVSIPTYILVGLSRTDAAAQEACGKYFFLGAFAAALMLYGFSFLYGAAGATTMFGDGGPAGGSVAGAVSLAMRGGRTDSLVTVGLLLAAAGLLFKIAAVPLHFYVPDVYQGAAAPVAGLLGFVPKFAGFVGLIRLLSLTGWQTGAALFWTLWAIAVATMTAANVMALMQNNVKRMLAYSSIAHSGTMVIGLLVGPGGGPANGSARNGVAALLFYIAVYGLMNLGAFAALAYFRRPDDSEGVEDLDQLSGAAERHPAAALALAVCVLGLMGFPPTAGFLAKLYVFTSAYAAADGSPHGAALVWLVVLGVINTAIAAAYYLRIVATCYLGTATSPRVILRCGALRAGLAVCAASMLALFAFPGAVSRPAADAALASSSEVLRADSQQRSAGASVDGIVAGG